MNSAIETTLLNNIKTVLSDFPEYWNEDTLLKNKVIDDLRNYDEAVITALLSNEKIKETYALPVGDMTIFKVDEFIEMLRYKNYWDNSYTKYRNEIVLTTDGKYLNYNTDVVLDFPFKDCVLEGGMSNEDEGKQEVYYHNVIAKEEIDTLLSPKVLTNIKKYDKDGEREVTEFSDDDNLILKGNNLLALHTIKERYAGKVKLIYIDPPFNTGNDSFKYNDRFNRSTWLTFMKNRLTIAKDLLREDGLIFVEIDKNEDAYLKILMDQIFGEKNFVNSITVQSSTASGNKTAHKNKTIIKTKDTILVYKKFDSITFNPQYIPQEKWDTHFNSILIENNGKYKSVSLKEYVLNNNIVDDNFTINEGALNNKSFAKFVFDNRDSIFTTKSSIPNDIKEKSLKMKNSILKYESSSGSIQYALNGRRLGFLSNNIKLVDGVEQIAKLVTDVWTDIDFNNTQNEGGISFPAGKKPELLLKRIISLSTNPGDIVLDFFLGSGSTVAVAHKLNRKFIGIEQMNYINTVSVPRLNNVLNGEQSGISKIADWQGGGSFVYAELDSLNQQYIDKLNELTSEEELEAILEEMKSSAYLNFKVELHKVTVKDEDFSTFSLDKKRKVLIDILDINQLYLNYSEIDDTQYDISEEVKQFNHSFYNQGGE